MPSHATQPTTTDWLSLDEAAEVLGYTSRAVRKFIAEGRLPAYRLRGGRSIRIKRTDVDAMLVPVPTVASR